MEPNFQPLQRQAGTVLGCCELPQTKRGNSMKGGDHKLRCLGSGDEAWKKIAGGWIVRVLTTFFSL